MEEQIYVSDRVKNTTRVKNTVHGHTRLQAVQQKMHVYEPFCGNPVTAQATEIWQRNLLETEEATRKFFEVCSANFLGLSTYMAGKLGEFKDTF